MGSLRVTTAEVPGKTWVSTREGGVLIEHLVADSDRDLKQAISI
jgi:hypothetical protein